MVATEAFIKAGIKNLKPFNKMSKDAHIAAARRGGRSKSIAKSEGAKLRCIKERLKKDFPNPEQVEWLLQKLNDRPSMAAELLVTLEKLKVDGVHPAQRVALLNTETSILKAIHGEKIKTENVNINVNSTIEEWENRLSQSFINDEEENENEN